MDEPLEVVHWLFLGWPDHGVPRFATSLISFIRHVRHEYKKSQATTPMLVHCSAGVGRTGTFILLDYMLERLTREDTINIHDFLIKMRSRRVLMVQTLVGAAGRRKQTRHFGAWRCGIFWGFEGTSLNCFSNFVWKHMSFSFRHSMSLFTMHWMNWSPVVKQISPFTNSRPQ